MTHALKAIHLQVMWNRLVAVVEEQAQALLRTAFGSIVRESGDLSAGVYNTAGHMLAQAITGTPGHVNTMAMAVRHFLDRYPIDTMRDGDVYVTNDPWLGTGHLYDYVIVTPVFRNDVPVGLFASTAHTVDVGGIGFSANARDVFEEGVLIPHLKLRDRGELVEPILAIAAANSRSPVELRGDVLSLVSANDVGARRLLDMMREFDLESIDELGDHILAESRRATLDLIAKLPAGTYPGRLALDGYDAPIVLNATLAIGRDGMAMDYAGSSPALERGINSPLCYTEAYSVFSMKCAVAPDIPNNAGSLSPFKVTAPHDTCVSPARPRPVTARHVIGQMLADIVFDCLSPALGGRIQAQGAGSIWVVALSSRGGGGARPFNSMGVGLGGVGARPTKDGLSTTAFPSGIGTTPIEILEDAAPVVVWRKEFLPDSGGPGRFRGGLGQEFRIRHLDGAPFDLSAATFERRNHPASGRDGGHPGGAGHVQIENGPVFDGKGVLRVPADGTLRLALPGGGGFGDPALRDPEAVARDVAGDLVSAASARSVYRVALTAEGGVDAEGTARLRA